MAANDSSGLKSINLFQESKVINSQCDYLNANSQKNKISAASYQEARQNVSTCDITQQLLAASRLKVSQNHVPVESPQQLSLSTNNLPLVNYQIYNQIPHVTTILHYYNNKCQ